MHPLYNASERVIEYYDDEEVKIQSPWRWSTLELYTALQPRIQFIQQKERVTALYSLHALSQGLPAIQHDRIQPRYTAYSVYCIGIHYTALYADPRGKDSTVTGVVMRLMGTRINVRARARHASFEKQEP